MFFKKKQPQPQPKTVRVNTITITTKDGRMQRMWTKPYNDKNIILPWLKFYKWFFGKSGRYFVFRYDDGEWMVQRDDILRFSVSVFDEGVKE